MISTDRGGKIVSYKFIQIQGSSIACLLTLCVFMTAVVFDIIPYDFMT